METQEMGGGSPLQHLAQDKGIVIITGKLSQGRAFVCRLCSSWERLCCNNVLFHQHYVLIKPLLGD